MVVSPKGMLIFKMICKAELEKRLKEKKEKECVLNENIRG